jgi:hypothetical protein
MWVVVWVRERPVDVREHLLDQAARPRRVVATPTSTFLLGPAPGDLRTLRDGLRVATYHNRSAVGLAWTDGDAWLLVRREGRVRKHRLGTDPDPGLLRDLAQLLDGDDVRDALVRAQGRGIDRLRHFLELGGHNAEARVLDWAQRGGPGLVPVHRAQWWERLLGEPRTAKAPGQQILGREHGVTQPLLMMLGSLAMLAAAWPSSPLSLNIGYPAFDYPVVVVLVCTAVFFVAHGGLLFSRWRRTDAFPMSDPLGIARTDDDIHR